MAASTAKLANALPLGRPSRSSRTAPVKSGVATMIAPIAAGICVTFSAKSKSERPSHDTNSNMPPESATTNRRSSWLPPEASASAAEGRRGCWSAEFKPARGAGAVLMKGIVRRHRPVGSMLQPAHHATHFRLKSRLSHPLGACFAPHQVADGVSRGGAVKENRLHRAHDGHIHPVSLGKCKQCVRCRNALNH